MVKINLKNIKDNLYLLLPMSCIAVWALLHWIHASFTPTQCDFTVYYEVGKRICIEPADLYKPGSRYYYLPILAIFSAITISLVPYSFAYYGFYIINIILGMLFAREYNKILILMGVKEKIYRFLFLMIISNGMIVYGIFFQNAFKYLIGLIIFFVIRREIQNRNEEKDYKYYFVNYGLFTFAVGLFPPFIFFLLIYVLIDIRPVDIFKSENLKKYAIVILMFAAQNFLFFIYPSYFFDFSSGYEGHNITRSYFPLFYLREWVVLNNYNFIYYISTIYMAIIALILILNNKILIEEKFAYFSFAWIIFSTYAGRSLLILFPFALLLFIPFLNQDDKRIKFFKKNKIILIGLLSVVGIYFMLPDFTIIKYYPIFQKFPFLIFLYLRWIILLCIFISTLLILYLKKFIDNR